MRTMLSAEVLTMDLLAFVNLDLLEDDVKEKLIFVFRILVEMMVTVLVVETVSLVSVMRGLREFNVMSTSMNVRANPVTTEPSVKIMLTVSSAIATAASLAHCVK